MLVRKEVLILRRDPLLLMRCSMQIAILLPAVVSLAWLERAAGLASLGLVVTGLTAVQLAAMLNSNDEGHEFVSATPLAPRERAWARAQAATLLVATVGWGTADVVLSLGSALAAALVAAGSTLNGLALAWLGVCTTRPFTAEERARNQQPMIFWQTLLALLIGCLGAGGVGICEAGNPATGLVVFGIGSWIACLLFLLEPKRPWLA
jgi:hypothetical protein